MAIQIPLKYTKSGGVATGFQEFEPTDQIGAGSIALFSGKNKLINGTMNFWQRQSTFTLASNSGAYTADRWAFNTGASVNVTVNRLSLAAGEVDQFPVAMSVAVTTVGGGINMRQPIEQVNTLAGRDATLSFWAKASSNGLLLGTRGTQVFGTGGSANVGLTGGGNVSLTTSWVRYTVPFNVPTIVGKTIGVNNCLQIIFDYLAAGTYQITGVQFEEGTAATDFEHPSYPDELLRCQRYYEKSYDSAVYPGTGSAFGRCGEFVGVSTRTTANAFLVKFMVTKRVTPAVVVYASETGAINSISQDNGTAVSINSTSAPGHTGFQVTWTNGSGRYGGSFHYTADSEF